MYCMQVFVSQVRQFIEMVSGADSLEMEQEDQHNNHHTLGGEQDRTLAGLFDMMGSFEFVLWRYGSDWSVLEFYLIWN